MSNKLTKERNRKLHPTNKITEQVTARGHLFNCIQDFANAATTAEEEIERLDLLYNSRAAVPGMNGRIHYGMWESMKTVSHFNLGIALELMLKLLLILNDKGYDHIHGLSDLHDALPPLVQQELESTFRNSPRGLQGGVEVRALITKPPPAPPSPLTRDLSTLKDFFKYFDEDVRLSLMRYSHELIEQREWRHYLSNISLFVEVINQVLGNIARYIPPEVVVEHGGTNTGKQRKNDT